MKLLSGQVSHTLDAKNRIRIPAKYKNAFNGEALYFVSYADKCIFVLPESALQARLERFSSITTAEPEKLAAKRRILSQIEEVEEDGQGRTVLSQSLRTKAGIVKDVVTVGMGDFIEIWAKERFLADEEDMSVSDAFGILGF